MAIYRQVHISFWQDPFVLTLTPEEKYFYLYLFTNSKTTLCGIYEFPMQIVTVETGYNRETVEKLIAKFEEYGKIKYSPATSEVCVCNWLKYNVNRSPKTKAGVVESLENVKDTLLKQFLYGIDTVSSVTVTVTENREQYGEFKNVSLTPEEYEKLKVYCSGKQDTYIGNLDRYMQKSAANKRKYTDHYAVIQTWWRNDHPEGDKPKKEKWL